jgi:hypothetical protein
MCKAMDNVLVQEHCAKLLEDIDSPIWDQPTPVPYDAPCRIDAILTHDHAFDRYVLDHQDEVSDHQLTSVLDMLRCARDECGGITFACGSCGDTKFVPFRCHSRLCPRCGKLYAEQWGRRLKDLFYP